MEKYSKTFTDLCQFSSFFNLQVRVCSKDQSGSFCLNANNISFELPGTRLISYKVICCWSSFFIFTPIFDETPFDRYIPLLTPLRYNYCVLVSDLRFVFYLVSNSWLKSSQGMRPMNGCGWVGEVWYVSGSGLSEVYSNAPAPTIQDSCLVSNCWLKSCQVLEWVLTVGWRVRRRGLICVRIVGGVPKLRLRPCDQQFWQMWESQYSQFFIFEH